MLCKNSILLCIFATVSSIVAKDCENGAPCIVVEQCSRFYSSSQQMTSSDIIQLLRTLHCGFNEKSKPMICCSSELSVNPRVGGRGESFDKQAAMALLPDLSICGQQTAGNRILDGTKTEMGEHPWMALIQYTKPTGTGLYCGGVLITSRYVMTAAHCVKGPQLPSTWTVSKVRLGEWNTSTVVDCDMGACSPPPLDIPIEQVIVHEGYRPTDGHQRHDIALLRLSQDVPFSEFVRPICLPTSPEMRRNTFEDYDLEVAGWGKTETRTASDVKLKLRVPVVRNSDCNKVYSDVKRMISNNQLCAGGLSGQDSCRGDSGGPLMGQVTSMVNWVVAGVVSYGPSPCGKPGWPGVYTRVTAYVDWILSNLRS